MILVRKSFSLIVLNVQRIKLNCQLLTKSCCRCQSTDIRNIGIMAHIDAGKTTTTERMLFYAGYIKRMGDIDAGDTVMDYLPTERERGITVQSAAISFKWLNTLVNLIDTPGHVDFTIEVERSLRVLDGAVAIFDASKGVEAQSRTVWHQADRYKVPRIAFINKMDNPKADLGLAINSLQIQLSANTILLQLPIYKNSMFIGVIDVVNMTKLVWDMSSKQSNHSGRDFTVVQLNSTDEYWKACLEARSNAIEQLCESYDDVAVTWLEGDEAGNPSAVSPDLLRMWLRRATLDRSGIPVFCGTSLKNVGVQPLLDAVVHYLPCPVDIRHDFTKFYKDSFTAMAFKVLFDKRLGPLVFARVYSGCLNNGMTIFNATKSCEEKVTRLMKIYADEHHNVTKLESGNIGLIAGLKNTVTGDTLVLSEENFNEASLQAATTLPGDDDKASKSPAVLTAVPIHEPVFFCTVEVQSITQEKALKQALNIITREDPSVHFQLMDNGTIILSGMGELHMEIVIERIRDEFKLDAYIGPLQVAYREAPTIPSKYTHEYSRSILGKDHAVRVTVAVEPRSDVTTSVRLSDVVSSQFVSPSKEAAAQGVIQACQKGRLLGYPVLFAKFKLGSVNPSPGCPSTLITAAAFQCARKALENADCQVVEPMMNVEVNTPESTFDSALNQLRKHQAQIEDILSVENNKVFVARAPVATMKGFASKLRSATSGLADLTLEMAGYQPVAEERLNLIRNELSGAVS